MASQLAEVSALTAHGAGEIFQAVVDGQVLSTILVLLSRDAGYYHSAGTSAEGMRAARLMSSCTTLPWLCKLLLNNSSI